MRASGGHCETAVVRVPCGLPLTSTRTLRRARVPCGRRGSHVNTRAHAHSHGHVHNNVRHSAAAPPPVTGSRGPVAVNCNAVSVCVLCLCIAAAMRSTQTILNVSMLLLLSLLLLLVIVVEAERALGPPTSFLNNCYDCVHVRSDVWRHLMVGGVLLCAPIFFQFLLVILGILTPSNKVYKRVDA